MLYPYNEALFGHKKRMTFSYVCNKMDEFYIGWMRPLHQVKESDANNDSIYMKSCRISKSVETESRLQVFRDRRRDIGRDCLMDMGFFFGVMMSWN